MKIKTKLKLENIKLFFITKRTLNYHLLLENKLYLENILSKKY